MKKKPTIILWALGGLLGFLVAAELTSRFVLGLGDPPLFRLDDKIEYIALPNGDYERFGNQISYNAYSMRSSQFPAEKTDPKELRILVVGDSVINGGNRTDQSELATELLKNRLETRLDRPVVVGNISTSSWGPANQLAYLEEFGTFDSDFVILVTHSQDLADLPTFDIVLGDTQPMTDHAPTLASYELVVRYGARLLDPFISSPPDPVDSVSDESQQEFTTKPTMDEIAELVSENGADCAVLYHLCRSELPLPPTTAEQALRAYATEHGMPIRATTDRYNQSERTGQSLYNGDIHLNTLGQQALADELEALTLAWLESHEQAVRSSHLELDPQSSEVD